MSLTKKVEKIVKERLIIDGKKRDALQRAEELADRYDFVKPVPYALSIERTFGLPAFSQSSDEF